MCDCSYSHAIIIKFYLTIIVALTQEREEDNKEKYQ